MAFKNSNFEASLELERQRFSNLDAYEGGDECVLCGAILDDLAKDGVCLHCRAVEVEANIREVVERECAIYSEDEAFILAMECLLFIADNTDFDLILTEFLG